MGGRLCAKLCVVSFGGAHAHRKTTVVGVTSMVSTVLVMGIVGMFDFPSAFCLDVVLNTICVICSMKFGQGLYEKFFFICRFGEDGHGGSSDRSQLELTSNASGSVSRSKSSGKI